MNKKSSAGVPPAKILSPRTGAIAIRNRGHLPHWELEGATYFVTFRLADSLPQAVLEQIQSERHSIIRTADGLNRPLSPDERQKLQQLCSTQMENYLDSGAGACHLKRSLIAEVVVQALGHFDSKRYKLFAWCVMPNHVHVLMKLFPGNELASVLHSWKSFSAKRANEILHRSGSFWQREYYDHLIRDDGEFEHAIRYIAENPEKAGLEHWPWVWIRESGLPPKSRRDGGAT